MDSKIYLLRVFLPEVDEDDNLLLIETIYSLTFIHNKYIEMILTVE